MASIDNREIVDAIIAGNGYYDNDPIRVEAIVEYENDFDGRKAWGLCFGPSAPDQALAYFTSPFCHNPSIIWRAMDDSFPSNESRYSGYDEGVNIE